MNRSENLSESEINIQKSDLENQLKDAGILEARIFAVSAETHLNDSLSESIYKIKIISNFSNSKILSNNGIEPMSLLVEFIKIFFE